MSEQSVIQVESDNWLIKIYAWAWATDPMGADLCRVFWGFVFLPLALLGHLLSPVVKIGEKIYGRWQARSARRAEFREDPEEEPKPIEIPKVSRRIRILEWLSYIVYKPYVRWPAFVGIGAVLLALLGYSVYLLATHIIDVLILLGVISGVGAVSALLIVVLVHNEERLKRIGKRVGSGFTKVGSGFKLLWRGLIAFKHSTCPRIEIIDNRRDVSRGAS